MKTMEDESVYEMIKDEFEKSGIFKDESKLLPDYVPEKLPHREEQLRLLARLFRVLLKSPGAISQKVIIIGNVGTGKTAVSKRFGLWFERFAHEKGIDFRYIHINCHKDRTLFLILHRIIDKLSAGMPKRGLSPYEMMHMIKDYLKKNNIYLLITLDEVNFLLRSSGEDVLYDIIRITEEEEEGEHRFSYILISRDLSVFETLDRSITSSLMHNIIKFPPYTATQIYDILYERAKEAFLPGTVNSEVLKLISEITGVDKGGSGDARYALELLWRAGKYAENEGKNKVTLEHVRRAKQDTHPIISSDLLDGLNRHEKLLLLAIARCLVKYEKAMIPFGLVEKEYRIVCEEWNARPRRHTQVWEYLQNLKNSGIIMTEISGVGYRGKTTLISLQDVPAKVLEKYLVENLKRR